MQHWLRGGTEDTRAEQAAYLADLRVLGVSEAEARAFLKADGEPVKTVFGLWPQNEEVLGLFFRLKNCWRLHPFNGKPLGLDLCQVEALMRLYRTPPKQRAALLDRLLRCERVVLTGE